MPRGVIVTTFNCGTDVLVAVTASVAVACGEDVLVGALVSVGRGVFVAVGGSGVCVGVAVDVSVGKGV